MKAAIVFNPRSGRRLGAATAESVRHALEIDGLQADLYPTQEPKHATALARDLALSADVIVVVGGDGTIHEVVSGMAEARDAASLDGRSAPSCRLGIVPAGTVNVVARELGLPFALDKACAVIAAGKTMSLDLGRVDDRRFVLMTGAGIDAVTIRNLDTRLKRRLRSSAFLGTGLTKGLFTPHPEFSVTADGAVHTATFCVAGNCRLYSARMVVTPTADPTDGLLDLMLFTGTTKRSILAFWLAVLFRVHTHRADVTCLRTQRARLTPLVDGSTIWLQADGEIVGRLPATVEIEPQALEVLIA